MLVLHICRDTGFLGAGTTRCTWISRILGVSAVEPQLVCLMVVSHTQNEDHTFFEREASLVETTLVQKKRVVFEQADLGLAIVNGQ